MSRTKYSMNILFCDDYLIKGFQLWESRKILYLINIRKNHMYLVIISKNADKRKRGIKGKKVA